MKNERYSEYRSKIQNLINKRQDDKSTPKARILRVLSYLGTSAVSLAVGLMLANHNNALQFQSAEIDRAEKSIAKIHETTTALQNSLVSISYNLPSKDPDKIRATMKQIISEVPLKRRELIQLHNEIILSFGPQIADQLINLNPKEMKTNHSETVSCKSDDMPQGNLSLFDLYYRAACGIALTAAADFPVVLAHLDTSSAPNPHFHDDNMLTVFKRLEEFERFSSEFEYNLSQYLNTYKPATLYPTAQ